MTRQLELIDNLVAAGKAEFTFGTAQSALGTSSAGTANMLRRLQENGLIDHLGVGRYAVRPVGLFHTSVVTDDLSLAVGTAFGELEHRIAYRSALSELGLLTHPVRTIYVACERQVRMKGLGRRPLKVVIEKPETIHLETDEVGISFRSTLERALFESALRIDLAGGVGRLAEALGNGAFEADAARISRLAKKFGPKGLAAERRLASMAHALQLPLSLEPVLKQRRPMIHLDPRDSHVEWLDERFRVAWNLKPEELLAVVGN
jgi:predicted transcriptional regulator of viral defense system